MNRVDKLCAGIGKLTYENIGNVSRWCSTFPKDLAYVKDKDALVTLCVLRLVLGELSACDGLAHEDSRVEAVVQIGSCDYRVLILFRASIAGFYVTDKDGKDRTHWYLQNTFHTREEQELHCFTGPGVYPVRLRQYRKDPESFWNITATMATTQTFRCYLRRFVQNFQPQQMIPGKDYWLHLEQDGSFVVRCGKDGTEISCLSETENYIYHYLCFLYLQDFWAGMDKLRNYKDVKQPILIRDFSDHLDQQVHILPFYALAARRNRQVLILKA